LGARSAVIGAFLNVKINAASLDDKTFVEKIISEGTDIQNKTIVKEKQILEIVESKI